MTSTTGTQPNTESDLTKREGGVKEKEHNIFKDEGEFIHCTGDVYSGGFEIRKKEHCTKMLGPGVYTTNEGDSYTGNWENDNLKEAIIRYTSYARYEGPLKDWSYSGSGLYYYPDETVLQADFNDNCPVGNLVVIDPNSHKWMAKAETGFAWFHPVNHYYEMLEDNQKPKRSKVKMGSPPKEKSAKKGKAK